MKESCAIPFVPSDMSVEVDGYKWARDTTGEASGAVYRLYGRVGAPDLFLKHGRDEVADDVTDEMVRLRWLAGHTSVPSVQRFARTRDEAWLLMSAIPGKTAYQVLEENADARFSVVDAIAAFLRRVHAIPISECPFNSDYTYRLSRARARIDSGLVDADDFDKERKGLTPEEVWEEMQHLLPFSAEPVVTHGDFSPDNLLMNEGDILGCIDVGRLGIADRYQDLAILWSRLGEFGSSLQERFFQQYGIADMDCRKLQFHLMLDELL